MQDDDALAWQMFGERLLRRSLTFEGGDARRLRGHLGSEIVLAGTGLEFFELQLELVEQALAAFRMGTEALAVQLGDLQLEVSNQGMVGRCLRPRVGQFRLGFGGALGHGNHQRLQRCDIVRQVRNGGLHGRNESASGLRCNRKTQVRRRKSAPYPVLAGRHEYCGLRQSIPSSKHAS